MSLLLASPQRETEGDAGVQASAGSSLHATLRLHELCMFTLLRSEGPVPDLRGVSASKDAKDEPTASNSIL